MADSRAEQGAVRNIGYTSISKILTYVSSAACSIVLGRCLVSTDYGVVSFALIFINFLDKFADIGFGSAIVQRKELDDAALYTAFTIKFVFGVAVTVATFILSGFLPYFIDAKEVVEVLKVLSLCFLFNNISFLPLSLLTREVNFKKISIVETTVYFTNSVVSIVLALNGYGYWSIVLANLVSNFLSAALLALIRPVPVRFRLDVKIAREIVHFGGYLFLSGLFGLIISNADNLIVGSVKGASQLGYYAIAFNWGSMICVIMYSVVLRVILPIMAKLQDQIMEIKNAYLKTLEYSGYVVILANVALFVISKEFLITVLGHGTDKWLPALAALRILCCYGILRGLLEPVGQVVVALGRTKIIFYANVTASVVEIATIYPALKYYGIEGVACAVTMAYFCQYAVYYYFLKGSLQISIKDLVKAIKPSCIAAVPVLLINLLLTMNDSSTLLVLLSKAAVVLLVYVLTLGVVTDWEFVVLIRGKLLKEKVVTERT